MPDGSFENRSLVLRAVPAFALLLIVASLMGRAVVPSAVGSFPFGDQLLLVDGLLAQTVALLSTALVGGLLVGTSVAPRPAAVRLVVVVFGGICLLVGISAAGVTRVPPPALMLVAATSCVCALTAAVAGGRRLPELALGLVGLAVAGRLGAVLLSLDATPVAAFAFASVSLVLEVGALAAAVAFLLRARRRGAVALGLALLAGAIAAWIVAARPEATGLVILRHTLERLAPRPHPLGPEALAPALASFALVLSVGLLLVRRADRAIVGSLSIVVLVRGHADVPLLGVALTAAAATLLLARAEALPVQGASARVGLPGPEAAASPSLRLAADRGVG